MKELKEMKKYIILIIIAVLSLWVVNNFSFIGGVLSKIFNVLFPFILGGIIAFILNILMSKIEKYLKSKIKKQDSKIPVRIISIVLSLLLFIGIILIISFLIIPELIENISSLVESLPAFMSNIQNWIMNLLDNYPEVQLKIQEIFSNTENISGVATQILDALVNGMVGIVGSIVNGVITIFTAIIFAIYMLSQKEYLLRGTKKLLNAYLKPAHAKRIMEIATLANSTFSKFISGQCLEAAILGVLMFVAFTIFRFPYALIISVLTAVTALVPIFGAIIAMIVGFILIAITDPIQAIIFVIVFQVVQQIEGNFIYPKVVGKSVGLSPMWTLLAISVGGSLFGIVGMIIGLPLASILYAILRSDVNKRIDNKNVIKKEKC